ncbi:MAG: GLPGLI family protein [Williamsia sp.]|nr:GLPGLI family protein [Williamsia sp.]
MQQKYILFIALMIFSATGFAQQFITKGKIEFERKTNQHAFLDENSPWDQAAKKSLPKFVTYYFDLEFDNDKLLYKAGRDADVRQNKYWGVFEGDNIISTNLNSSTSVTQKSIYGDTYLISDSLRKIDWKIGAEIRKIAGFDCRKAVGRVMDSIVVIAFYSDEILPSGGPESFTGLPGMILGIAVPKMHTTWYATKLQLTEVKDASLASPTRGKKIASGEFQKQLKNILKNWGKEGERMEWQLLL